MVHDPDDRAFVAGNRLGREQEQVALFHLKPEVLAAASCALAARRSPWLPVTSSIRFSRGIAARVLGADHMSENRSARRSRPPPRPCAASRGPAARPTGPPAGRLRQRLQPRDVRGEGGGDDHALAASRISSSMLGPSDRLGPARMWREDVGRIADQRPDAGPSRPRPRASGSNASPTTGVRSSLKSPVWMIRPCGRVDHQRRAFRDRMRDRQEADRERPGRRPSRARRDAVVHQRRRSWPCSSIFSRAMWAVKARA